MEPERIVRALRSSWVVVISLIAVGALLGIVLATQGTPVYRSKASGIVTTSLPDGARSVSGSAVVVGAIAPTLVEMSTSDTLLGEVATATGAKVSTLRGSVSASSPTGTLLLEVTATASSPQKAQKIAAAEIEALRAAAQRMSVTSGDASATLTVDDVDTASLPTAPIAPSRSRYGAVGIIAGGLLGLALALLREFRRPAPVETPAVTAPDDETSDEG